jgi:site-specific recombinase
VASPEKSFLWTQGLIGLMDTAQKRAAAAGGCVFALAVVLTVVGSSQKNPVQTALYVCAGVCYGIFVVLGLIYCVVEQRQARLARSRANLFLDDVELDGNDDESQ